MNTKYNFTQKVKDFYKKRLDGNENNFSYVAIINGKIVGCLIGGIKEAGDYRNISKIVEGETVFIEEEYRGQGIGTEFMKMLENWAKEKGAERLRYIVSSRNEKAIKLYKELGCEVYDVVLEKVLD